MAEGDVREIKDKDLAMKLIKVGYIEDLTVIETKPRKKRKKKIEEESNDDDNSN